MPTSRIADMAVRADAGAFSISIRIMRARGTPIKQNPPASARTLQNLTFGLLGNDRVSGCQHRRNPALPISNGKAVPIADIERAAQETKQLLIERQRNAGVFS